LSVIRIWILKSKFELYEFMVCKILGKASFLAWALNQMKSPPKVLDLHRRPAQTAQPNWPFGPPNPPACHPPTPLLLPSPCGALASAALSRVSLSPSPLTPASRARGRRGLVPAPWPPPPAALAPWDVCHMRTPRIPSAHSHLQTLAAPPFKSRPIRRLSLSTPPLGEFSPNPPQPLPAIRGRKEERKGRRR
jgi:hypothetical protein